MGNTSVDGLVNTLGWREATTIQKRSETKRSLLVEAEIGKAQLVATVGAFLWFCWGRWGVCVVCPLPPKFRGMKKEDVSMEKKRRSKTPQLVCERLDSGMTHCNHLSPSEISDPRGINENLLQGRI